LVLSGEATRDDAEKAPQQPSLIIDSVSSLC
jgi:ribonucleotide monophosphatase NagD (HAD superfamily)